MKTVGVSSLRIFTATKLLALTEPVVVYEHNTPIAALVPYALYLQWQELVRASAEERQA